MINISRTIRTNDWWDGKLSPLMAVGYATILLSDATLISNFFYLLLLILAIVIGAVYVSIINDITDIDEDISAGKINRMLQFKPVQRSLLIACCLTAGSFAGYLLYPDRLSLLCYAMPWLSFSLYSIPPVRLKNRGFWGVLADAAGSHLFPCSFIILAMSYHLHHQVDLVWLGSVATWSLVWGFRGILWHQFYDRDRDLEAGVNTYASQLSPEAFRIHEIILMAIEFLAILLILVIIAQPVTYMFMLVYLVYTLARSRLLGVDFVFITIRQNTRYQIFMNDYYCFFLPASLILSVITQQSYAWLVLILQIILFISTPKNTGLEVFRMFRVLRRSVV